MFAEERFTLTAPRNGKNRTVFQNNINQKQGKLFIGTNDLAGQQTLFVADGFDRPAVPMERIERVFATNPSADIVLFALECGDDAIIHRDRPEQCDRVPSTRRAYVMTSLIKSGKRVAFCTFVR